MPAYDFKMGAIKSREDLFFMEKNIGIYEIRNSANGKVYVGQSRNIAARKSNHKSKLIKGTHYNVYLQREFNKYGKSCFSFNVLEFCSVEMLNDLEIKWISKFDSMNNEKGYNLEGGGQIDKIISEKVKAAKMGDKNPMYGKKLSQERIDSIRESNRGSSDLLTEKDVSDIKRRLCNFEEQQKISEEYGVHFSTINKIATCANWEWVAPELNDKLLSVKKNREKVIKKLYDEGKTASEISKIMHCTQATVTKAAGTSKLQELRKRAELIANDYERGLTREQLEEKYDVKRSVVNRAVKELYQKELRATYDEWLKLRSEGVTVSDIAKMYNVHRTTVTQNTKEYWGK